MHTFISLKNLANKNHNKFWNLATFALLLFAVLARIYFYYKHKDLWLDEASLAFIIYGVPLQDIFFQPLPSLQAAPLGFLLCTKGLGALFGYSEYVLYFLPLLCGIGTLFLSVRIGREILGYFGGFLLLLFCVGAQNLLYYTTELKQYGIEAFCSFLLLYCYLIAVREERFRRFFLACMVCIIFANTAIFTALALGVGIVYYKRHNFSIFIKHNIAWILGVGIFFALYYFLYLKFQRIEGFYTYWADYFLPHKLSLYPHFIKETLLSILSSFTPLSAKHVWIYVILWCVGIVLALKERRDIFIISVSAMLLFIALSLLRIYPFGHGGVIGSRLSLYMSPFFYLPCCYVFAFLAHKRGIIKILTYSILALLCYKTLLYHKHTYPNGHFIQQTHALIRQANTDYTKGDSILVYESTQAAYKYYSFLDSNARSYVTFSKDLEKLESSLTNLTHTGVKTIYLLGSHYPGNDWLSELKDLSLKFDKNAVFTYGVGGWGSFLIEIHNTESHKEK